MSQAPGPSESELALQESISSLQQERDALSLQYQAQVTYTDHVTHALSWSAFAQNYWAIGKPRPLRYGRSLG